MAQKFKSNEKYTFGPLNSKADPFNVESRDFRIRPLTYSGKELRPLAPSIDDFLARNPFAWSNRHGDWYVFSVKPDGSLQYVTHRRVGTLQSYSPTLADAEEAKPGELPAYPTFISDDATIRSFREDLKEERARYERLQQEWEGSLYELNQRVSVLQADKERITKELQARIDELQSENARLRTEHAEAAKELAIERAVQRKMEELDKQYSATLDKIVKDNQKSGGLGDGLDMIVKSLPAITQLISTFKKDPPPQTQAQNANIQQPNIQRSEQASYNNVEVDSYESP